MNQDLYIHGLSKTFSQITALHETNLVVRRGKFTTLLGPSGCGKTTLLRLIAGLETPDTGTITMGEEILFSAERKKDIPAHLRHFGMVFQDFALWPHMTVFENVAFGLRAGKRGKGFASVRDKELRTVVLEALDMVRLSGMEDRYPHQLSGGQQQRVAFARAVAIRPRLVLFDEPLSALDAVLREEMRIEMLSLVRDLGLTALYVTHDQIEAMSMSDEVVVMKSGHILQTGTPEVIYGCPAHPEVARFIGKSNWLEPERTLFRPEHVRWEQEQADQHAFTVEILHVSYVGDRYEIRILAENGEHWTAYHSIRLPIGQQMHVWVSPQHIHQLEA
ncbi:ABC transporter ATP-binding protein [Paenibacillus polymyxa]|uniref:ABC transporter ATP-binding protein n=1 Tax=Paenibacillus polymyxa TaxID=1406 RepID=UPI00202519C3|nr:ABC transporter ATP-binding protein [Paenibacillus polymyxa]URJ39778.1 ABC transporter ATP-binding protein [Paenibacillus polymyxa]